MVIQVKDYTWRQTENVIIVRVPLKGIHYSKADVFTFENYIKAHFVPFLFEVFLAEPINNDDSKCTMSEGEIIFELQKVQCNIWEALEAKLSKAEKRELRQQALIKSQERDEAERSKRSDKRCDLQRQAVREQIALDTKHRELIQELKDAERGTAMEDLECWKRSQTDGKEIVTAKQLTAGPRKIIPVNKKCNEKSDKKLIDMKKISANKLQPTKRPIFKMKEELTSVPFPREEGRIEVKFSSRVFPTPSRESRADEEEEWLKKQAEARRISGFVAEDLSPEEQDPVWLKEKGDSFFKLGNHLGAISAYSHAIKIGSKMPALYSNRAAAHIALGNLRKAVEDSSTALELLTPCVPMNAESRMRCHIRRGTALCRLGLPRHGLADLEAALKLQPGDADLLADVERARALAEADDEDEAAD